MCRNTIYHSALRARSSHTITAVPHHGTPCFSASVCFVFALVVTSAVRGDDVLIGNRNLTRVRIVGLSRVGLDVRMPDGSLRSLPIDQVDLMQIDRGAAFADFNQAERMRAEGRAEQSIARYRRAMRLTEGFWSEIIPARFLRAADQAGELAIAVSMFVRVVEGRTTGPATAVRMFPTNVPDKRNGEVAAALDTLNIALAGDLDDAQRAVLSVLRYRILQRVGAGRDAGEARRVAQLSIPEPVRTLPMFETVNDALTLLVEQTPPERDVMTLLDHAIRDCPVEAMPAFLLLKGAALISRAGSEGDWLRASWPFLRVAIHFPDDPHVAEAYYGASTALEKAGQRDYAVTLLRRCLENADGSGAVTQSARAMLERLTQPDGTVGP